MFILGAILVFLLISMLRTYSYIWELERRNALTYNATLSNASLFLVDGFSDAWLEVQVQENGTAEESQQVGKHWVEPDWSIVLGTFTHYKDENLKQFLTAAGVPFFVRNLILSSTPTVTITRVFKDDYYYYDLDDHYPDEKYEVAGWGEEAGQEYQLVVTTSTWIKTNEDRFRLGYSFIKQDYDGTPSKNTYIFVAPTVLYHRKEKKRGNTSIIHTFSEEGLVTTLISGTTGLKAQRHFLRDEA